MSPFAWEFCIVEDVFSENKFLLKEGFFDAIASLGNSSFQLNVIGGLSFFEATASTMSHVPIPRSPS